MRGAQGTFPKWTRAANSPPHPTSPTPAPHSQKGLFEGGGGEAGQEGSRPWLTSQDSRGFCKHFRKVTFRCWQVKGSANHITVSKTCRFLKETRYFQAFETTV